VEQRKTRTEFAQIVHVNDKEERRAKSEQHKKDKCEEDTEEGTPKEELTSTYISRDRRNIEKR